MEKENIIVKKDTSENWKKAINFIPKDGEILFYSDIPSPYNIKIGDGKTKINELPFVNNYGYSVENNVFIITERRENAWL